MGFLADNQKLQQSDFEVERQKYEISTKETGVFLGLRISAVVEIILFLTVITFYNVYYGDGMRFIETSPHPFWIILLLIVVQYGTYEGLVCVVLMTVALYTGNIPEAAFTESNYDYWFRLSKLPITWTVATVVLGGLCKRKLGMIHQLSEQLESAHSQNEAITEAYSKLQSLNTVLESRLAGELGSAIKIYEAAKSLESLDTTHRFTSIKDVVMSVLKPDKFSLYLLDDNILKLRFNYGWTENDRYISEIDSTSDLFQNLIEQKNLLSVINEPEAELLRDQGIVAGPLIDTDTGKVFGMLKVEQLHFESLNLKTLKMFSILCEWIGMALNNITEIEKAREDSLIDHDFMIYTYNFLKCQTEFLTSLARRLRFPLTKITVSLENANQLDVDQRRHVSVLMGKAIGDALRKVDQIFDEEQRGEKFAVLLPGTGEENANIVIDKIRNALIDQPETVKDAKYFFTVEPIHTPESEPK